MDLAVMTEPHLGGTYEEQLAVAQWAEGAGLTAFARCDHFYSGRDPRPAATDAFTVLAGIARETSSIELTVLVAPITFRHPGIYAKAGATLDQMSNGRFRLGLGTGWMELEHEALGLPFPPSAERWERFEEALQYVRATIDGDHASFAGQHYQIEAELKPRPTRLPLVVGGGGAHRTPRLAGTYADEYNHFVTTPEMLAPKVERVRSAATSAGRDADAIRVSLMGPILVGEDRADYEDKLGQSAAARDRTAEEHAAVLTNAGVPHGTADDVRAAFDRLGDAGVDLYYVQYLDLADLAEIKRDFSLIK